MTPDAKIVGFFIFRDEIFVAISVSLTPNS